MGALTPRSAAVALATSNSVSDANPVRIARFVVIVAAPARTDQTTSRNRRLSDFTVPNGCSHGADHEIVRNCGNKVTPSVPEIPECLRACSVPTESEHALDS